MKNYYSDNDDEFVFTFAGNPIWCEVYKCGNIMRLKMCLREFGPNFASVHLDFQNGVAPEDVIRDHLVEHGLSELKARALEWKELHEAMHKQKKNLQAESAVA